MGGSKGTLWEGGTRTLASLTAPKYVEAGGTDHTLIHVTDWYTTLLSAAGLNPSSNDLDGLDQWATLRDPAVPSPRTEILYNIHYPGWGNDEPNSALRIGDWKYVRR